MGAVGGDGRVVADFEEAGGVLQQGGVGGIPRVQVGARFGALAQVGGPGILGGGSGEKTILQTKAHPRWHIGCQRISANGVFEQVLHAVAIRIS
jgi:hypothetical protein